MKKRLLIVDDSALMRRHLRQLFEQEGDFDIRLARNGVEAIREAQDFHPDVITLDINMPEMDGLTALSHLMGTSDAPVIMLSSLTERGALVTLEALALGAVDFVAKPGGTISLSLEDVRSELLTKVRGAIKSRPRKAPRVEQPVHCKAAPAVAPRSGKPEKCQLVVVGVSTGGPGTLETILPQLEGRFPVPIVVAQHMPDSFTAAFAQRLNQTSQLTVIELGKPTVLEAGHVYIARGGADAVISKRNGRLVAMPRPALASHLWHPSVELLMRSALDNVAPEQLVGVMLTGMGSDGAEAFSELKKRGGRVIAESEESAVVFGMPKEVIRRGAATEVLPAEHIARQLEHWCSTR
jgi:two-component system, chemotaxis family, protein-glutamate methylesterase/glutaminase